MTRCVRCGGCSSPPACVGARRSASVGETSTSIPVSSRSSSLWSPSGTAPRSARPRARSPGGSIDIDAETVSVLKAHRAAQAAAKLALGPDWTDTDRVFVREDGRPIHPEVVSKRFLKLGRRQVSPRITLHGLRHTHVAILAHTDVPVKVISERLGHATVAFTLDRYAHVLPGAQSEAAARFVAAVS